MSLRQGQFSFGLFGSLNMNIPMKSENEGSFQYRHILQITKDLLLAIFMEITSRGQ
jgi:hypothetical protein